MSISGLCDYCNNREAITTCEVCGAKVCQEHKKEYGCEVCEGGKQKF